MKNVCIVLKDTLLQRCSGSSFQSSDGRVIEWIYNRHFTCNSKNALYVVVCNHTPDAYLGKTDDVKQRMYKHASDVRLPHNSKCRECSEHLRDCSRLIEPYFSMYPFYYEDDPHARHTIERRFIMLWKPSLNGQ